MRRVVFWNDVNGVLFLFLRVILYLLCFFFVQVPFLLTKVGSDSMEHHDVTVEDCTVRLCHATAAQL